MRLCDSLLLTKHFEMSAYYLCLRPTAGVLSNDACLTSVSLTSVAYIGPKSRTERPRKTKMGREVAHVTRDLDTTFKVKGQLAADGGILWRPPTQLVIIINLD